jgi:hypothetical protein
VLVVLGGDRDEVRPNFVEHRLGVFVEPHARDVDLLADPLAPRVMAGAVQVATGRQVDAPGVGEPEAVDATEAPQPDDRSGVTLGHDLLLPGGQANGRNGHWTAPA